MFYNWFYNLAPCRLHIKCLEHHTFGPLFTSYSDAFLSFICLYYCNDVICRTDISPSFFPPLRYDLGQGEWVCCNVHIQKMCHYPVFGLKEGTLYQFRVRAVNKAGPGRPSKATEPVLTADPLEHTRSMGNTQHHMH